MFTKFYKSYVSNDNDVINKFFAEAHPFYLGCCVLSTKDYVHVCIEKIDLIFNIGYDVVEKPPFFM
jgi:hypothetical protein